MNWTKLTATEQLKEIQQESHQHPVLIFKHSTRCNISRASLDRLERNWNDSEMKMVKPYFLDLLSFRNVSNEIVNAFQVEHESPQVLLISNGKAILDLSHFAIDYGQIKDAIKN